MHVYPTGAAAAADDFNVSFDPEVDLPAVAMAAGAGFGATVTSPGSVARHPEGGPRRRPGWPLGGSKRPHPARPRLNLACVLLAWGGSWGG